MKVNGLGRGLSWARKLAVSGLTLGFGLVFTGSVLAGWSERAHADTYLYVVNGGDGVTPGTISVVRASPDGLHNTVFPNPITVGLAPIAAASSPDGSKVWVTNGFDNSVSQIRTDNNTVSRTIPVGNFPTGVVVSRDGRRLYVLNFSDNNVRVLDTSTAALIATIQLPVGGPNLAALNPTGTLLYVTNFSQPGSPSSVSAIDTYRNRVVANIPVGSGADGVAVSPDGAYVYVTNVNDNTVSIITTSYNRVVKTIPSGGINPNNVNFTLDGSTVYVTNGGTDDTPDNHIGIVNPATKNLVGSITGGAGPTEVDPNPFGLVTYVPNFGDSTVSVIRNADKHIISSFGVGVFPVSIAIVQK